MSWARAAASGKTEWAFVKDTWLNATIAYEARIDKWGPWRECGAPWEVALQTVANGLERLSEYPVFPRVNSVERTDAGVFFSTPDGLRWCATVAQTN
jgi:hypothetical protein